MPDELREPALPGRPSPWPAGATGFEIQFIVAESFPLDQDAVMIDTGQELVWAAMRELFRRFAERLEPDRQYAMIGRGRFLLIEPPAP